MQIDGLNTHLFNKIPKWVCHKQIRSSKILEIKWKHNCYQNATTSIYQLVLDCGVTVDVNSLMFSRSWPKPGDYYAVHKEGWEYIIPCKEFEDEYSLIVDSSI